MTEYILYFIFLLLFSNVLASLPFVKLKDKIKIGFISGSILLAILSSLYLALSFYLYHLSPVIFSNEEILNLEKSGYLLAVLLSYFFPILLDKEKLFGNNKKVQLFYFSSSLLFISVGIILPFKISYVIFFIGLTFLYFLVLSYNFYVEKRVGDLSKILFFSILVLLVLPLFVVDVPFVSSVYNIFLFSIVLITTSLFFINLLIFSVIRNLQNLLLLPLFVVLYIVGYYQLSRFLSITDDINFYNITAIIGFLSALLSVLASFSAKQFKDFLFFITTSVSGVLISMLGLSRYFELSFSVLSAFYLIIMFVSIVAFSLQLFYIKEWNRLFLFFFAVFIVAMVGLPPFSIYFSKIEFVSTLISYKMWSWVIGFLFVWILQIGSFIKVFGEKYEKVDFQLKTKIHKALIFVFLSIVMLFLAFINPYYVNGFWGIEYIMLFSFFVIYLLDVYLPKVVSGASVFVLFELINYKQFSAEFLLIFGFFILVFMFWVVFNKKSKGIIPIFWLFLTAIVGVWDSNNIFIFSFWSLFASLTGFLMLFYSRGDFKNTLSYLYLSLIGDFLIFVALAKFYNGESVLLISDAIKYAAESKVLSLMVFGGILIKLPILGFRMWVNKISLHLLFIIFYPFLIMIKFYLSGFHCIYNEWVLAFLIFIFIVTGVKAIDTDNIFNYLKNMISVSATLILLILVFESFSISIIAFITLLFSFLLFLYFISLFTIIAFESDNFSEIGNLFKKNTGLGLLSFLTFIWFYSIGIFGISFTGNLVQKAPFVGLVILLVFGMTLAYYMYNIFDDGINLKSERRIGVSLHLFILIVSSAVVLWLLPLFYELPNIKFLFFSVIFFLLLFFTFNHGAIGTILRNSKLFELFRMTSKDNLLLSHFKKMIDFGGEVASLLYRDDRGFLLNIILFVIMIFVFAW